MNIKGYYFITDRKLSRAGNAADVAAAAAAGVSVVQYRAKDLSTRALCDEAAQLKKLARGALFIVNDRLDVALAVGAGGVHIGQDDMPYAAARELLGPGKIIGVTVHSVDEAREAAAQGADYLGVSPIFPTGTKLDAGLPGGIRLLEDIRKAVDVPLVAIGGISLANAGAVISAGADSLCAISAVVAAADAAAAMADFNALFRRTIDNK